MEGEKAGEGVELMFVHSLQGLVPLGQVQEGEGWGLEVEESSPLPRVPLLVSCTLQQAIELYQRRRICHVRID